MRSLFLQMVLFIYTRSSRAERPLASEYQKRVVREHLDRLGIPHERARIIVDATNVRMDRRPGYKMIAALSRRKQPFILAVQDLTRLGRIEDIFSLIKRIVGLGGRFISVEEPVDTARMGWKSFFEYLIERRAYCAYRRRRGEVDDE